MRKKFIPAFIVLLMTTSSAVQANDFRMDNPSFLNVGWEKQGGEQEMRSSVYLRSKLKRLELENEDLRNSISQMRKGKYVQNDPQKDARIQALLSENNRLMKTLKNQNNNASALTNDQSADIYAHKLAAMNSDIKRLKSQLGSAQSDVAAEYEGELRGYKAENNRLKSSLNAQIQGAADLLAKNEEVKSLNRTINELENKNYGLQKSLQSSKRTQNTASQDNVQEISELKIQLSSLMQEKLGIKKELENVKKHRNASLGQEITDLKSKVSSLTQEKLYIQKEFSTSKKRADDILAQENADLQIQVSALTQEKLEIKTKLSDVKSGVTSSHNREIVDLQTQNESLRKTIEAQNDVLRSADNASKVAEAMLSENSALKYKLEQRKSSQSQNTASAKTLIELNNKLQDEIAKRDNYIEKLKPLKDAMKALRNENEKLAFMNKQSKRSNAAPKNTAMQNNKNAALDAALEKERASVLEYRKKIKTYQDDIISLEKQNSELIALQLENQNLKAQVNLLSTDSDETISKSTVKYIETSYPKVDKVRPILNSDGGRIGSQADDNAVGIAPEDILSHSLKPLSELK